MSARQDVFKYMGENPEARLNEVLGEFSSLKESTIRRYFFEYQKIDKKVEKSQMKIKGPAAEKKTPSLKNGSKKTIKQTVFDYMQGAPDTKLTDLIKAFPSSQKTTIGNYRRQWLKENEVAKQNLSKSKKNEIFSFLDNNPGSNINDLKKVFPEVANKLVTIFRSWKNSQSAGTKAQKGQKEKVSKSVKPKTPKSPEKNQKAQGWLEKHKDTIARQREIIEKQKTRIETLKSQLPTVKKIKVIDSIKKFIVDKLSKG